MKAAVFDYRSIFSVLVVACWATAAEAENWPAWRGPTGQGVSAEKNLPLKWSPTENVRWKVKLPWSGNSTPIIWGDRVFITQASDPKVWPPKATPEYPKGSTYGGAGVLEKRSVLCFQRTDGKLLWQRDTIYKLSEPTHPTNPFCSESPVTDGERVVACHGSAGLVCYDFEGKQLWNYDFGKLEHVWGTASSPILYGDLCIQWCGPGERQFLLAVNKHTGKKVWETPEHGGDTGITSKRYLGAWGTPLIVRVGEQDQLLMGMNPGLKGFDPKTGKELWRAKDTVGIYALASPLFVDGIGIYGSSLVKLGGSGDITKDKLKYKVPGMYASTAVIHGDYLYTYGNGISGCHEWKTGRELWKERSDGGDAWGSPVYADGRVYITDRQGTTTVVAAGAKYELLEVNRLGEGCNASIAVSQGNLFIRTHKHLWCIGKEK